GSGDSASDLKYTDKGGTRVGRAARGVTAHRVEAIHHLDGRGHAERKGREVEPRAGITKHLPLAY
ncbi:MAG: hypothetical protein PHU43_05770, partial [Candidatus Bipolaricaulis sp.]|nr:hypothetical protein [Candidatus Bipolaricaulis sp.]